MTHLDLFTGVGGFHLAASWAGFQTVGFAEIDPYCCKLLAQKWPEIKNYGDVRTADFSGLRGRVDVLSAGVPCQPASNAGQRRGARDDRWLWETSLDVIRDVEPAWAIFENPPGILSLDEFGGVLLRLESLGYAFRAFGVSANSVGAKHRRQRIFIVANARGQALADADRTGLEKHQSCGQAQCTPFIGGGGPKRFRLTQPPLCRRADGIRNRSQRIKALGNSVVPAQVYPFFEAIAQSGLDTLPVL